jgi:outer membrane protein assembly factor BamA
MARGYYLRFILIAAACFVFSSPSVRAQLPPRLERCLPYPTFAQETKEVHGGNEENWESGPRHPRITITSVGFPGQTALSKQAQEQLVREFMRSRQPYYDSDAKSLLDEFLEVGVTGTLRDGGYFHAKAEGEADLLSADALERRYSFTVRIAAGPQYRLGSIRFTTVADPPSATIFAPTRLRTLIPMRQGDVFNISRVLQGLESITRLYQSFGHLDATVEPDTLVRDDSRVIDLVFRIDEQKQFRIGKITVVSPNPRVKTILDTQLEKGQIFNPRVIGQFLRRYKSILPSDASERDVSMSKNVKDGTVDITFDFWACPLAQN